MRKRRLIFNLLSFFFSLLTCLLALQELLYSSYYY